MIDDESHGIPADKAADVIAHLGITEHTAEDCRLSEVLHLASGAPVVADGTTVYLQRPDAWERLRIRAGDRRRILAGHTGEVELLRDHDGSDS